MRKKTQKKVKETLKNRKNLLFLNEKYYKNRADSILA